MSPHDLQADAIRTYRDLRRSINILRITSCLNKSFIPEDDFNRIFTRAELEKCAHYLLDHVGPDDLDELYARYRKTIAILVLMDYESSFVRFWENEGYDDDSLPLDAAGLGAVDAELLRWNLPGQFMEKQFLFLAPKFSSDDVDTGRRIEWTEDYVLPLLEKTYRSRGNFSTVYKIKIHPSYDLLGHDFDDGQEVKKTRRARAPCPS